MHKIKGKYLAETPVFERKHKLELTKALAGLILRLTEVTKRYFLFKQRFFTNRIKLQE